MNESTDSTLDDTTTAPPAAAQASATPPSDNQTAFQGAVDGTVTPPASTAEQDQAQAQAQSQKLNQKFNEENKRKADQALDPFIYGENGRASDQYSFGTSIKELLSIILGALGYGSYGNRYDPEYRKLLDEYKKGDGFVDFSDPGYDPLTHAKVQGDIINDYRSKVDAETFENTTQAAQALLKVISEVESSHDLNAFNDFRKRVPGYDGGADAAMAKLGAPDCENSTVAQVRQWQYDYNQIQKDYRDANFPKGIPLPQSHINNIRNADQKREEQERLNAVKPGGREVYRSTAIGQYQFIRGTLGNMVKGKYIKASDDFDARTQHKAAVGLIVDTIKANQNLPVNQIIKKLQGQWEGLNHLDAEQKADLRGAVETLSKADNLAALTASLPTNG